MLGGLFLIAQLAIASDSYPIGVGDKVQVDVFREPDLSMELTIDDGCNLSLGLASADIRVCGKTRSSLSTAIEAVLADGILVDPRVTVTVLEHKSQRVEVLGQVHERGPVFLKGETSLLEVIDFAGGAKSPSVIEADHYIHSTGLTITYDIRDPLPLRDVKVADGDRVILKEGRSVYVEGEVTKPGTVPYRVGLTVTQALTSVGGPSKFASPRRATVIRASGIVESVNLWKINKGRNEDVRLGPEDRVLIKRSAF